MLRRVVWQILTNVSGVFKWFKLLHHNTFSILCKKQLCAFKYLSQEVCPRELLAVLPVLLQ
jgi:hypothetical protein